MVERQVFITVVSVLVVAIAIGAIAQPSDEKEEIAQLCDEKEERERGQLQKQCEEKKVKSEKYWNAFEEAQRDIAALLRVGNLKELSRYIGCHAADMSLIEIHCESYLPIIDKTHIEPFMVAIAKNPGILDSARWVVPPYKIGKERYRLLCADGLPFKAAYNYCDPEGDPDGAVQPLIEINEVDGKIYISGVPVSGVWTSQSGARQQ